MKEVKIAVHQRDICHSSVDTACQSSKIMLLERTSITLYELLFAAIVVRSLYLRVSGDFREDRVFDKSARVSMS